MVITRGDLEWFHLQSHSLSRSLFLQTLTERCLCARLQGRTLLTGSHLAPALVQGPPSFWTWLLIPGVLSSLPRGAQRLDQAAGTNPHAAASAEAAWLSQPCSSCSVSLTPQDGIPAFILPTGALLPACCSYQGDDLTETHEAFKGFPGGTRRKNLLAVWEMWVRSLGWEDPLEKEMATHSSILSWRIPWTEEPLSWKQPWGLSLIWEHLKPFPSHAHFGLLCCPSGSQSKLPTSPAEHPAILNSWAVSQVFKDFREEAAHTHTHTHTHARTHTHMQYKFSTYLIRNLPLKASLCRSRGNTSWGGFSLELGF